MERKPLTAGDSSAISVWTGSPLDEHETVAVRQLPRASCTGNLAGRKVQLGEGPCLQCSCPLAG